MAFNAASAQRETLVRNVIRMAAERGLLVTLGTMLDAPVRVRDRETDHVRVVRLRDVRADDVRAE